MNTILSRIAQRVVYPAVTVLALASAFAAHAESPMPESQAPVADSGITRAQVQAELFQARRDGSLRVYSITYNPATDSKSTLTREEVKSQLRLARNAAALPAAGETPANVMTGEDSGSFYLARQMQAQDAGRALAAR